jgi:hypothetical protein
MPRRRAKPLTATDGAAPHQRVCEAPGCKLAGEFRAPRARDRLTEYRWFCLEHVRDYKTRSTLLTMRGWASGRPPGSMAASN